MNFDVGKVIEYENHKGRIFSKNGVFDFLDQDIVDGEKIELYDYVVFRKETVDDIKHASFIRFFTKTLTGANNQIELERLLKRKNS